MIRSPQYSQGHLLSRPEDNTNINNRVCTLQHSHSSCICTLSLTVSVNNNFNNDFNEHHTGKQKYTNILSTAPNSLH
eukprot:m.91043 g.91043  ORF g.91043 m.91043 type:complete len:77 (+) comp12322_c0_seq7:48-278(+)